MSDKIHPVEAKPTDPQLKERKPLHPNEALNVLVELQRQQLELLTAIRGEQEEQGRAIDDMADELDRHGGQLKFLKKINFPVQVWFWLTVVIPVILIGLSILFTAAGVTLFGALLGGD
jgi:hypothetical protein